MQFELSSLQGAVRRACYQCTMWSRRVQRMPEELRGVSPVLAQVFKCHRSEHFGRYQQQTHVQQKHCQRLQGRQGLETCFEEPRMSRIDLNLIRS